MPLLTDTNEVIEACRVLAKSPQIFVDTEFLRERTYYPKLCLIQIAGTEGDAIAIDPLVDGISLEPVMELLYNKEQLKVMHAGRQDMEILVNLVGKVPTPLFDTQVAAMVLGMGDQLGYEGLVGRLTGHKINKAQQYTDWSRRPLKPEQLEYALDDVRHLRDCYLLLLKELEAQNRMAWFEEEMQPLGAASHYMIEPSNAWLRIRKKGHQPHYLARMQALAEWREKEAMRRNLPRGRILSDDALQEIALTNPHKPQHMQRVRGLPKRDDIVFQLLDIVKAANTLPEAECPSLPKKIKLTKSEELIKDALKLLLKCKAAEHNVSSGLLCSQDALVQLIRGNDSPALHGWRYEMFGRDAQALLAGKLSVSIRQGVLTIGISD